MTLHEHATPAEKVAAMGSLPAKVDVLAPLVSQEALTEGVLKLTAVAPSIALRAMPGQFVQVGVNRGGTLLRRPLGIAEADTATGHVSLIYRVAGKGTLALSQLKPGDEIKLLGPLGHGFSTKAKKPLLVGGGMGLSPLLYAAGYLWGHKTETDVLMGGRTEKELFWQQLFKDCAKNIHLTTDDGSLGTKGFVTTILPELLKENGYDLVIACGPEIMMKNVAKVCKEHDVPCEVSLERRMGCGLGACLSCSIDTVSGRRKVCKDGPVFPAEEVFF